MMDQDETSSRPMSRGMTTMLAFAATVIAIWGLKMVAGFAGPVILAVILVITVYPVRRLVEKLPLPDRASSILGSVVTVVAVYVVIAAILWSLVLSVEQLITLVPRYSPQFTGRLNQLGDWLQQRGVSHEQITSSISKLDIGQAVPVLQSLAGQVKSFLTNLLLFAMIVLFTAFDAPGFVRQLGLNRHRHASTVDALAGFASGVRRYFVVSAVFGLVCAVFDTAVLMWIGIPAAFTWGILAFVTNFVPNIGFIVGLVPPAILALLDGGFGEMVVVIVAYILINFVVQSLIQPKVVGDALGLTATISFVSLVFWAFVLGPLGAILALPMTLLVKAIFVDADPSKAWLQPLLAGEKAAAEESKGKGRRPRLLRWRA